MSNPPKRNVRHKWEFVADSNAWLVPVESPEGLWELLCDCCTTDPEKRPTFAEVKGRLRDTLNKARVKEGASVYEARETFVLTEYIQIGKQPIPTIRDKKGEIAGRRGSDGERLKKLLVFHIKDSTESPIDFFNLAKNPEELDNERSASAPPTQPARRKSGFKIKSVIHSVSEPALIEKNKEKEDDSATLHKHKGKTIGHAVSYSIIAISCFPLLKQHQR